jgi:AraC family transcriptional regulator of arabinose operon
LSLSWRRPPWTAIAPLEQNCSEIDIHTAVNLEIARHQVPAPDTYRSARLGRVVMQPGETRGMPLGTTYHVLCIHTGEAFVRIGAAPERHVPAGHAVLFRPQDISHRREIGREPSLQTWVAAVPDALTAGQMADLDAAPAVQPFSVATERLHSAILDVSISTRADQEPAAESALLPLVIGGLMLYVHEARVAGSLSSALPPHPAVEAAQEFARRHFDQPISLEDLAAAAHVSAEHLVRLFRRDLGLTPSRYLWQLRLRAGIHLLGHSTLPVAEIAHRSGFQTPSHFSRAIREATRLRPGELRRRSLASATSPGDALLAHP